MTGPHSPVRYSNTVPLQARPPTNQSLIAPRERNPQLLQVGAGSQQPLQCPRDLQRGRDRSGNQEEEGPAPSARLSTAVLSFLSAGRLDYPAV